MILSESLKNHKGIRFSFRSNPHFVRCLKPNSDKLSNNFDMQLVLDQVKCLGVLDTVRIRRLGYPIRYRFSDFVDK